MIAVVVLVGIAIWLWAGMWVALAENPDCTLSDWWRRTTFRQVRPSVSLKTVDPVMLEARRELDQISILHGMTDAGWLLEPQTVDRAPTKHMNEPRQCPMCDRNLPAYQTVCNCVMRRSRYG